MNLNRVDQIAKAVLYEGYMLYPYRPSSVKNQQRWNFGVLYPQTYSEAQGGTDAYSLRAECLVRGSAGTRLEVNVRFLQLQLRSTQRSDRAEPSSSGDCWQEAVERNVAVPAFTVDTLLRQPLRQGFEFPEQTVVDDGQNRVASVVRRQAAVLGELQVTAQKVGEGLFRIATEVRNATRFESPAASRDDALLQSLVSAHAVLGVEAGEFISLLEPPSDLQELAAQCQNSGVWPVLVGDPGQTRHPAGFAHHSLRLSADRAGERRGPVRRHRD